MTVLHDFCPLRGTTCRLTELNQGVPLPDSAGLFQGSAVFAACMARFH